MDATTQFIDTTALLVSDLEDLRKHIAAFDAQLKQICSTLGKGEVTDKETRLAKLKNAESASEALQGFITYAAALRIPKLCGSLEILSKLLEAKEDELWLVRGNGEQLNAPQIVDHLTDAITDYLLAHQNDNPSPKANFVDNPDSFVAGFVKTYLDHPITDRMSDMVISLVTDWMSFRMPD